MRKFNKVQTKHNYWVAETKGDVLEGVVTKKGIEIVTLYGELEVIEITTDEGEILRVSLYVLGRLPNKTGSKLN